MSQKNKTEIFREYFREFSCYVIGHCYPNSQPISVGFRILHLPSSSASNKTTLDLIRRQVLFG